MFYDPLFPGECERRLMNAVLHGCGCRIGLEEVARETFSNKNMSHYQKVFNYRLSKGARDCGKLGLDSLSSLSTSTHNFAVSICDDVNCAALHLRTESSETALWN
ncbi:hypothetical protein DPMN_173688 [Dreissena polymorpha]|uniref:Uncharacterized protein n=1 Tax=Dreissena polymorpha TaxID=45954 RepID=A0A9D4E371_DREPO|nr:hypothetical protein DPMN_173688 [Dreissena polymorpha]